MKKIPSLFVLLVITFTLIVWVLYPNFVSATSDPFRYSAMYVSYVFLLVAVVICAVHRSSFGPLFLILSMFAPFVEGVWAMYVQGLAFPEIFNGTSDVMFGLKMIQGYIIFSVILPITSMILGVINPFSALRLGAKPITKRTGDYETIG